MPIRTAARTAASFVPPSIRDVVRPAAVKVGLAAEPGDWTQQSSPPWAKVPKRHDERWCNICHWTGDAFASGSHSEFAHCPQCESVARDRFLIWCLASRPRRLRGKRVIETSPRMGEEYRSYMCRWFDYRTSDFDLSMHTGDIRIDLQDIDLPDADVDVVLTPHVLEHVPDTERAIAELYRVIAPGGRMLLQIPIQQGATGTPTEPEFHADNTPVHWRFGWNLVDLLRGGGFRTRVLVVDHFARMLAGDVPAPDTRGTEFDAASLVEHARPHDLTVIASDAESHLMGFEPSYQFVTWECIRP